MTCSPTFSILLRKFLAEVGVCAVATSASRKLIAAELRIAPSVTLGFLAIEPGVTDLGPSRFVCSSSIFTTSAPQACQKSPPENAGLEKDACLAEQSNAEDRSKSSENKELVSEKETGEEEISGEERAEEEITREELIRIVEKKEQQLKAQDKDIQEMQDKVLRSYAEAQNVRDRTRRVAENSKKFAMQVFKKYGVGKYDPLYEEFDPNRLMAAFQVPDLDKKPGTVAVVSKPGYTLHGRVIRPAQVAVVEAVESEVSQNSKPSD